MYVKSSNWSSNSTSNAPDNRQWRPKWNWRTYFSMTLRFTIMGIIKGNQSRQKEIIIRPGSTDIFEGDQFDHFSCPFWCCLGQKHIHQGSTSFLKGVLCRMHDMFQNTTMSFYYAFNQCIIVFLRKPCFLLILSTIKGKLSVIHEKDRHFKANET